LTGTLPTPGPDIDGLRQLYPLWQIDAAWTARASGPDLRVLTASRGGVRLAGFSAAELARMIETAEKRWPRRENP
jgi:hypothetical protein